MKKYILPILVIGIVAASSLFPQAAEAHGFNFWHNRPAFNNGWGMNNRGWGMNNRGWGMNRPGFMNYRPNFYRPGMNNFFQHRMVGYNNGFFNRPGYYRY